MRASFAVGVLFAAGHHVFYQSLDGRQVDSPRYGQEMRLRIGTGLSYIVRASLVIAIGSAYWQMFWETLPREPLPTSAVDSLAALLNTLPGFLDTTALRANAVFLLLAAVFWLIPFAAVVPPATLTVSSVQLASSREKHLPGLNFLSGPMASVMYDGIAARLSIASNSSVWPSPVYAGPTQPLVRVATSAALQGQLPSLPRGGVNSSYRLDLKAPRVRCGSAP